MLAASVAVMLLALIGLACVDRHALWPVLSTGLLLFFLGALAAAFLEGPLLR